MMDLRNCFLTSAQSGMTMEPKTIFIIAAVVLAIVFLILWQKEREKSKRSGAPYTPPSPPDPIRREITVPTTTPGVPGKKTVVMTGPSTRTPPAKPVKAVPAARPAQRSLDAEYADRHNLWICPHCETMNSIASSRCAACGMVHGKRGDSYAM